MRNIFKKPINYLRTKFRGKPVVAQKASNLASNLNKIIETKKKLIAEYASHPENKSKIGMFNGFDGLLNSFTRKEQLSSQQLTKLENAVTELINDTYGKTNFSERNSPQSNFYFSLTNLRNEILERKKSL